MISPEEFRDQALYPHQMNRYEVFEGKSQAQTDDGVAPSTLDMTRDAPELEVTGYAGGGVY